MAAALFALVFHARLPGRLPSQGDYQAVGQTLARERQSEDGVLLVPWWTERARLFVPAGLDVTGYLRDEGDDLERYRRVWVLSQPHLPEAGISAFERQFLPGRTLVGTARSFGNLSLSLYANGRYRPTLFSATGSVAEAHVYLEAPGGARIECPFDGKAHRCQGPEWLHVAAEWHEVDGAPKKCLWMHAPGGATKLVAEFAQAPAGTLRLEAGYVWDRHSFMDRTASQVGVDNAGTGAPLVRLSLPPGTRGFQKEERALAAPAGIRVWAQSEREDLRELCVEVRSLGG